MTRSLLALALLASLAGCKIGGGEEISGAAATCAEVGAACTGDAGCCSYGCVSGVCAPNPLEGGACRTTSDCTGVRLCKGGACVTPTTTANACRDTADVCSSYAQCCSGNCEVGRCTVNQAPVADAGPDVLDAPYTKPFTLANASTDPDDDPLTYGWSLLSKPPGSLAALGSAAARNPTFTPDVAGSYVLKLVVTDGPTGAPNRLTAEDQVTIVALNRSPVPAVSAPAATWSRNVAITVSASVSDPDGDALECAWLVTPPGAAPALESAVYAACANPSTAVSSLTPALEGTYEVHYLVRDRDRTSGAVVNTAIASVTFVSVNDAPVPVTTLAPYYGNLGPPSGPNPTITLDATPSTDPNGDHLGTPGLSFFWELVSASDGGTVPALTDERTATPSFVPERAVDYVLQLTVFDPAQFGRAAAFSTQQVTVKVGRYIRQLDHDVVDAAYAKTANKIVLAGHDPSDVAPTRTKGMIWVYDVATAQEGPGVSLVDPADATASGIPKLVGVTPDGAKAVVVDRLGEGVSVWVVTLGTGAITRLTRPFDVGELVVASARFAYLFGASSSDAVRQLDLTTGTFSTPFGTYGYGTHGAASAGASTPYLYRIDASWGDLYRYRVDNNSLTPIGSWAAAPTCGGYYTYPAFWATLDNNYLVTTCGTVHSTGTLGSLVQTLPFTVAHVDSLASGSVLAVEGGRTSLRLLNTTLQPAGTDAIPRWAQDGVGRTAYARKAFLNATARTAVVYDTASPARHGVVTFP